MIWGKCKKACSSAPSVTDPRECARRVARRPAARGPVRRYDLVRLAGEPAGRGERGDGEAAAEAARGPRRGGRGRPEELPTFADHFASAGPNAPPPPPLGLIEFLALLRTEARVSRAACGDDLCRVVFRELAPENAPHAARAPAATCASATCSTRPPRPPPRAAARGCTRTRRSRPPPPPPPPRARAGGGDDLPPPLLVDLLDPSLRVCLYQRALSDHGVLSHLREVLTAKAGALSSGPVSATWAKLFASMGPERRRPRLERRVPARGARRPERARARRRRRQARDARAQPRRRPLGRRLARRVRARAFRPRRAAPSLGARADSIRTKKSRSLSLPLSLSSPQFRAFIGGDAVGGEADDARAARPTRACSPPRRRRDARERLVRSALGVARALDALAVHAFGGGSPRARPRPLPTENYGLGRPSASGACRAERVGAAERGRGAALGAAAPPNPAPPPKAAAAARRKPRRPRRRRRACARCAASDISLTELRAELRAERERREPPAGARRRARGRGARRERAAAAEAARVEAGARADGAAGLLRERAAALERAEAEAARAAARASEQATPPRGSPARCRCCASGSRRPRRPPRPPPRAAAPGAPSPRPFPRPPPRPSTTHRRNRRPPTTRPPPTPTTTPTRRSRARGSAWARSRRASTRSRPRRSARGARGARARPAAAAARGRLLVRARRALRRAAVARRARRAASGPRALGGRRPLEPAAELALGDDREGASPAEPRRRARRLGGAEPEPARGGGPPAADAAPRPRAQRSARTRPKRRPRRPSRARRHPRGLSARGRRAAPRRRRARGRRWRPRIPAAPGAPAPAECAPSGDDPAAPGPGPPSLSGARTGTRQIDLPPPLPGRAPVVALVSTQRARPLPDHACVARRGRGFARRRRRRPRRNGGALHWPIGRPRSPPAGRRSSWRPDLVLAAGAAGPGRCTRRDSGAPRCRRQRLTSAPATIARDVKLVVPSAGLHHDLSHGAWRHCSDGARHPAPAPAVVRGDAGADDLARARSTALGARALDAGAERPARERRRPRGLSLGRAGPRAHAARRRRARTRPTLRAAAAAGRRRPPARRRAPLQCGLRGAARRLADAAADKNLARGRAVPPSAGIGFTWPRGRCSTPDPADATNAARSPLFIAAAKGHAAVVRAAARRRRRQDNRRPVA